ncbi:MAG: prolipoprotein diacylglyceryl transferase family protein [Thermodesulfobacteriota bacterium]
MNHLFLLSFALFIGANLWWGITALHRERWQIIATVPYRRTPEGWQGINLTYYGLFNANAYVLAVLLYLLLLEAGGAGRAPILLSVAGIVGCCAPASRLIARLVEKKAYTFTVGGASFLGLLLAPPLFSAIDHLFRFHGGQGFPVAAALAALAIAYALGEGLGRLACISFGCCYGRSLESCPAPLRRLFARHHVRFHGKTRKVAYESGLDGTPLVPVQAITATLSSLVALAGIFLYGKGMFTAAFLLTLTVTQLWRVFSETLRADYRGGGRMSAYQRMALFSVAYGGAVALLFPATAAAGIDLTGALGRLWSPPAILLVQCGWLAIFLYTGKSMITGARISFHVHRDRI